LDQHKYSSVVLYNHPNPFHQSTTIEIDAEITSPSILEISNQLGQIIKTIMLDSGEQKVDINAANFDSGIYYYALKVNGKIVGSNKMMVSK
jgi:hypothetical protein